MRTTQFFTMSWADVLSFFLAKGSKGPMVGVCSKNSDMRNTGSKQLGAPCECPGPPAYLVSFVHLRSNLDCQRDKIGKNKKNFGIHSVFEIWKAPRHYPDETHGVQSHHFARTLHSKTSRQRFLSHCQLHRCWAQGKRAVELVRKAQCSDV